MYPQWEPQNLSRAVPSMGPDGVDLLSVTPHFLNGISCFPCLESEKTPYVCLFLLQNKQQIGRE